MFVRCRKALGQSAYLSVDQVLVSAGNFLTAVACARALGAHDFGVFSIAFLVTLVISSLIAAAIIQPMMTAYAQLNQDCAKTYIDGNFQIFHVSALLMMMVGLVIDLMNWRIGSWPPGIGTCTAFCAMGTQFQELVRRVLILESSLGSLLASELVTYGARLLLILALSSAGYISVSAALLVLGATGIIGAYMALNRQVQILGDWKLARWAWRLNFPSAKWLIPSGLMQWSSVNYFLLIAPFLVSPIVMAHVRAAQNLATMTNPILLFFENLLPVNAARHYQSGARPMLAYLLRVSLFGVVPLIVTLPIVFYFGESLVFSIYKFTDSNTGTVLTVFCASQIVAFAMVPLRIALRTIGRTNAIFLAYAIASLVSVLLAYWLISNWRALGIASGMALANFALVVACTVGVMVQTREDKVCHGRA